MTLKAVLFQNLAEYPSTSMRRYARELATALRRVCGGTWEVEESGCTHVALAARLLPGARGAQLASRLGRTVKYPLHARRARGEVFHVLDHSHANLTAVLDPARTVLTCHDVIPLLASVGRLPIPVSRVVRCTFPLRLRCMKRCARIITDSEATRRDLLRYGGLSPERVEVVYLGVGEVFTPAGDGREERAAVRARFGLPPEARLLLHVGTGSPYKNVPGLFRAFELLRRRGTVGDRVWLLQVGAPLPEEERALLRSLGLEDRVLHAGSGHDDETLARFYRAADVFIFPSLWEGFGWPPLEAMACGTPVITSDRGSLPEVVGDAGIMVGPENPVSLADAIEQVLTREELRLSMREMGLSRARTFTWERTARQTLAVYETIVTEKSSLTSAFRDDRAADVRARGTVQR